MKRKVVAADDGTAVFMALSTAMFLTSNSVGAYLSTYLLKTRHLPLGTASQIVLIGYLCTILAHLAGHRRAGRQSAAQVRDRRHHGP